MQALLRPIILNNFNFILADKVLHNMDQSIIEYIEFWYVHSSKNLPNNCVNLVYGHLPPPPN